MKNNLRLEPPPTTLPPGSTVWAYLRDSGGPTQDRSVQQQRNEIFEYCNKYGLVLIHAPFEDVHKTGTNANRNELDYMMSLSSTKSLRPNGLLIWNHARFSRGGPHQAQFLKGTLRSRGIVIHSLTDQIPDGPFAPVIESMIDAANEQKAKEASMGAWRGLRSIVKQGAAPGTPPVGMKKKPIKVVSEDGIEHTAHRWEPDPAFKHRINTAFKMKSEGRSLSQIHEETRLYGSINSYVTFFKNPIYIGTFKYGDMIFEKYCSPAIPRKLFEKVQKIMEATAQRRHLNSESDHPRRKASPYLLSGMLHCARCGAVMNGLSSPQPYGEDYRRYLCTSAKIKKTCAIKPVPAKVVEKMVLAEIHKFFDNPQNLIDMLTRFKESKSDSEARIKIQLASYNSQLATVRKAVTNTANAISSHGISNALSKRLTALEEEETGLLLKINNVKAQFTAPVTIPTIEQARTAAHQIQNSLCSEDPLYIRQILLGIIAEIQVDRMDKTIVGIINIYHSPTPVKKKTIDNTVSILPVSVGAPIYRHSISFEGVIQNSGRPKKKPVV